MKNSAETKTGFSLFSIDEHRLSIGLLVMLLLAGAGYGIWLVVSPLLPSVASQETTVSRNESGDAHFSSSEWPEAIGVYREILEDDPDNGYVILKIALAKDNQLTSKWTEYERLDPNSDGSRIDEVLDQETQLFESACEGWNDLLDNARYRQRAFQRLAVLHSFRSKKLDKPENADKAIAVLEAMLESGCTTARGMLRTRGLVHIKNHQQFSGLVQEERRISKLAIRYRSPTSQ